MKAIEFVLIIVCASSLVGCSAGLRTKRVANNAAGLAEVDGLAVNENVPHRLIAIFPEGEDTSKLTTIHRRAMLPSAKSLYVLNYNGALFMSRQLEVELHPDTTLKRVKINSTAQAAEDLAQLTAAAAAVKPVIEKAKAEPPKPPGAPPALDAENAALKREILNLMLKANREAVERGDQPIYPGLTP